MEYLVGVIFSIMWSAGTLNLCEQPWQFYISGALGMFFLGLIQEIIAAI